MFRFCKTEEDSKKLFRRLAHFLHPDKGGESDLMQMLVEAYEDHKEIVDKYQEYKAKENKKSSVKYENSYEDVKIGDERLEILDEISQYGEDHPRFSSNFVESVRGFLEENGFISSGQYNGLVNVYYKFRMNKKD